MKTFVFGDEHKSQAISTKVSKLISNPGAQENIEFFKAFQQEAVFPDEGKQVSASAEMYQQAIRHPEKAVYWKLTIEFGKKKKKMQQEWCRYCIRELEKLQQMTEAGNHPETPVIASEEET